MYQLDKKDKQILAILSINSRLSYAQIGKKIGQSKDTVAYRIKNLEKHAVISGYTTFFDFSKLGLRVYKIYVKFKGLTQKEEINIKKYLKSNEKVGWVVEGNGSWDMVIGFQTPKIEEFYNFKLDFEKKFHDKINSLSTTTQIQAYLYSRKYFSHSNEEVSLYSETNQSYLDAKDYKIIQELAKNSRLSILDLSKKTGLTVRTIGYRIKQLEKQKVILQYRCSLNLEKLKYIFVKAFIKISNVNSETKKAIMEFFKNNSYIVHNVECLGDWELEPEFEIEDMSKFYLIINKFRSTFAENIEKVDSMVIHKEEKYQYVP